MYCLSVSHICFAVRRVSYPCNREGPYVGVSDGRIFKWQGRGWREFAYTAPYRRKDVCDGSTDPSLESICGRPLGAPDNIKRNARGNFWVALNDGQSTPSYTDKTIGVRVDEQGRHLESLHGNGYTESVSEINEYNGIFSVGSVVTPYLTIFSLTLDRLCN
ncbi:hypothetical protein IFM89_029778 [Coptis chinensis]|uniref:Strictosidine synthase n=1 Tax=Coptis chinensis TaxID=261450 RepID=A0A835MAB4_9MAGN|nr:hypothetical protein IFM89_029778 [Coptis chinensis]